MDSSTSRLPSGSHWTSWSDFLTVCCRFADAEARAKELPSVHAEATDATDNRKSAPEENDAHPAGGQHLRDELQICCIQLSGFLALTLATCRVSGVLLWSTLAIVRSSSCLPMHRRQLFGTCFCIWKASLILTA